MRCLSRQGVVLGAGMVLLFAASTPAVADREESLVPSGGQENGNLNAQVEVIKYDTSKNGNGPSAGPVAAVSGRLVAATLLVRAQVEPGRTPRLLPADVSSNRSRSRYAAGGT